MAVATPAPCRPSLRCDRVKQIFNRGCAIACNILFTEIEFSGNVTHNLTPQTAAPNDNQRLFAIGFQRIAQQRIGILRGGNGRRENQSCDQCRAGKGRKSSCLGKPRNVRHGEIGFLYYDRALPVWR